MPPLKAEVAECVGFVLVAVDELARPDCTLPEPRAPSRVERQIDATVEEAVMAEWRAPAHGRSGVGGESQSGLTPR